MTVKDKVLLILQKNIAMSGEEIANQIGCTRAAVWKAIKSLQADGMEITGVNNVGYTLKKSGDVVSKAYIENSLKNAGIKINISCVKSIDSTNNKLKTMASDGYMEDMVLIAEEQTAGRGRRGRSFYSPEGTGVYLSFLLHPEIEVGDAPLLTTMAVTAEACAIEKVTNKKVDIKWVNDVLIDGKKVSGILTEAQVSMENGSLDYVVCGIGINLYEPENGFPDEIKDIAGAIVKGEHPENLKNEILSEFIINFMNFYKTFPNADYLDEYSKRCIVIGKDVDLLNADHEPTGVRAHVLSVNDRCHLHVRYEDGKEDYLYAGEISVRT